MSNPNPFASRTAFSMGSIEPLDPTQFGGTRGSQYDGLHAAAAGMSPGQQLKISNDDPSVDIKTFRRRVAAGLGKSRLPLDRQYNVRVAREQSTGQLYVVVACVELSAKYASERIAKGLIAAPATAS